MDAINTKVKYLFLQNSEFQDVNFEKVGIFVRKINCEEIDSILKEYKIRSL